MLTGRSLYFTDRHWKSKYIFLLRKCGEKKRFRVNKADVTDDKLSKKEEERQRKSIREKKKVKKISVRGLISDHPAEVWTRRS